MSITAQDQYLQGQLPQILVPGEQVLHTAYMRRAPGLLMQILLLGGLLTLLMTKAYYAALTNRRLILVRTKMGFWSGKPQPENLGVESIDVQAMKSVSVSGFANNKSMTFHMQDGKKHTLRISPWFKWVAGTKAFYDDVPNLINGGQMQLAAGGMQPAFHVGPQQSMMQLQQPQAADAPQLATGIPQGSRVSVLAPDGHRYPATVLQEQGGHFLCAMPNGQQHWFPVANVSPA
jgi:hypothetical protein